MSLALSFLPYSHSFLCAVHHSSSWMQGHRCKKSVSEKVCSAVLDIMPSQHLVWLHLMKRIEWSGTISPSPAVGHLWYKLPFCWIVHHISFLVSPPLLLCMRSQLNQPVKQELRNRKLIVPEPGKLPLPLPRSLSVSCWQMDLPSPVSYSDCSQLFSWKIVQFKRELACFTVSESVWSNQSTFSQAFSLQLLSLETLTEVEILW